MRQHNQHNNIIIPAHEPYFFKLRRKPKCGRRYNLAIRHQNIMKLKPHFANKNNPMYDKTTSMITFMSSQI